MLLTLCACGQQGPAAPRDPAPAVASHLDATARAFVELTIATDDQAVKLLDLGAGRASSPGMRAFAESLAATRRAELREAHAILDPIPYVNYHEGHDMPGMPTDPELTTLSAAPDFDAYFAQLLRAHLTESTTVARAGATSIKDERARALASTMLTERGESLHELDRLAPGA